MKQTLQCDQIIYQQQLLTNSKSNTESLLTTKLLQGRKINLEEKRWVIYLPILLFWPLTTQHIVKRTTGESYSKTFFFFQIYLFCRVSSNFNYITSECNICHDSNLQLKKWLIHFFTKELIWKINKWYQNYLNSIFYLGKRKINKNKKQHHHQQKKQPTLRSNWIANLLQQFWTKIQKRNEHTVKSPHQRICCII